LVREALETWIPLMAPVTPHLAEELWELIGKKPFASTVQLASGAVNDSTYAEEAREQLLERLMSDVSEILKVTEIKPKKAVFMTAPRWKHDMLSEALGQTSGKTDVPALIKSAMSRNPPAEVRKEIPKYAKELTADVPKMSPDERKLLSARVDEIESLTSAKGFLEGQFGCPVLVFSGDDPDRVDPMGKARFAKPGRPAVYLE
jgi:leucyl-tRNA synthetase